MISINSVVGNIHNDYDLAQKYNQMIVKQLSEIIRISRSEAQRSRMRKTSNKGSDVAIMLPQNVHIKHGDVLLLNNDKIIIVEIQPEKVAVIAVKNNIASEHLFEMAVKVGHTIGNLHRPIKLEDNKIILPIQAESELDLLKKVLGSIKELIDITSTTMVFEPEEGADVHEH
ncbi:MAG: urease accessory protein UreE [Nitrososphaeraceae archaeon]|jgi:urease accessory protein